MSSCLHAQQVTSTSFVSHFRMQTTAHPDVQPQSSQHRSPAMANWLEAKKSNVAKPVNIGEDVIEFLAW